MKLLLHRGLTFLTAQIDSARNFRSLLFRAAVIHAPFLLLYVAVSLLSISPQRISTYADSGDYLKYANSIVESAATGTNHVTSLWFGPGYPLLLVPAVLLRIGIIPAMLVSPVLLYAATVFFFLTARRFLSTSLSLLLSATHALYYPYLRSIQGLWSDPLAVLLVCAMCSISPLLFVNTTERSAHRYTFIGSLLLGYLSLTKPLFGYVFTVLILFSLTLLVLTRCAFWRQSFAICLGAGMVALPYLCWTYNLTGKVFYWGTAGGSSLYFMTTGYDGEYGSWMPPHRIAVGRENYHAAMERHYQVFDEWKGLTELQRDERLKHLAIDNIRKNPLVYIKNVLCNACRLFLDFPYSYEYQKPSTLFYILPNIFLLVGGMVSIGLWIYFGVRLPSWLLWVGMLGVIYLGGTLLLSAYPRMLFPSVPILVLWEACILSNCVSVRSGQERSKQAGILNVQANAPRAALQPKLSLNSIGESTTV